MEYFVTEKLLPFDFSFLRISQDRVCLNSTRLDSPLRIKSLIRSARVSLPIWLSMFVACSVISLALLGFTASSFSSSLIASVSFLSFSEVSIIAFCSSSEGRGMSSCSRAFLSILLIASPEVVASSISCPYSVSRNRFRYSHLICLLSSIVSKECGSLVRLRAL